MLTKLRPITPGSRHYFKINKYKLCQNTRLYKSITKGFKRAAGRSTLTGHRTSGHKGAGKKNLFRPIKFYPQKNISIVIATTYDPFRTSFISLCYNFLTALFYNTRATNKVYPGTIIFSGLTLPEFRLGSIYILDSLPAGTLVHSITGHRGPTYIRAAGTFGVLIQKKKERYIVKMPSGRLLDFSLLAKCVVGSVSNTDHAFTVIGKAGRARAKHRRPHVRGVAMNPVDHPHGGQTSGGRPSVTPWGKLTKGQPTVRRRH